MSDVSDIHAVASQSLCPSLPKAEIASRPVLAPIKVTCSEPVVAPFADFASTDAYAPCDSTHVALPVRTPTVKLWSLLCPFPWLPRHATELSESHPLASQTLRPDFIPPV